MHIFFFIECKCLELSPVKNAAGQLKDSTRNSQTYEDYCTLFVAVATSYDDNCKSKPLPTSKNNNGNRRVYEHLSINRDNYSTFQEKSDY